MADFVRIYDVLTQARSRLFDWIRPLSPEQYTREFPFGHKTLRRTMIEIASVELFYTMRLQEQDNIPPWDDFPISEKNQPLFADLEGTWKEQVPRTRGLLASITDWDRIMQRRVERDGKMLIFSASKSDLATQMLMHEVHHRAQAMAMLRHLGVEAQNLDYIYFVIQRREESL